MTYNELNELIWENYIPSSIERKKAISMYFFVWILIWLTTKNLSIFERFHIKQSIWWWLIFISLFIISAFIYFVPYIWYFPMLIFAILFWIWWYLIHQAWKWEYIMKNKKIFMPVFYWIWGWLIEMFEIEEETEENDENIKHEKD